MLPEIDPGGGAAFAFAHEFKMVGGDQGSMGLSTGSDLDATGTKSAFFSIRNAVTGAGAGAASAVDRGDGWSCRVPYPWEAGRPYGMRI